jgi:hypothetical protein
MAGVEYGGQCYCGNAFNAKPQPSTGCTMACTANHTEKVRVSLCSGTHCGGTLTYQKLHVCPFTPHTHRGNARIISSWP